MRPNSHVTIEINFIKTIYEKPLRIITKQTILNLKKINKLIMKKKKKNHYYSTCRYGYINHQG